MKYYLDEDLSPRIAKLVRKAGVDCISAHEVDMLQASDYEQLEWSAREKRCFVTKNRDDFIRLTVLFFNGQLSHSGVLIVPNSMPGDRFSMIAEALVNYTDQHPKGMHPYTIDFLSSG